MISIIIDCGYIFHKNIFGTIGSNKQKFKYDFMENYEEDSPYFIKSLMNDFKTIFNSVNNIYVNDILFAMESKSYSWRKKLYKNIDYKGNRKKSDAIINWKNCNKVFDEFISTISENFSINNMCINSAEADDIIYLYSKNNRYNNSNIIISSDTDIDQCLNIDYDNNKFTIRASITKGVFDIRYPYEYIKDKKNDEISFIDDILCTNLSDIEVLDFLISNNNNKSVNPSFELFKKIIIGDVGDNIPPIMHVKKKNTTYKFTEKMLLLFLNQKTKNPQKNKYYNYINKIHTNIQYRNIFIKNIKKMFNIVEEVADIEKRILENINIIYLNNDTIPINIISEFNNNLSKLNFNKFNNISESKLFNIKPEWDYTNINKYEYQSDYFNHYK